MNNMLMKVYVKAQNLMSRDEGQDLVEYALLVALISLAAVVAVGGVADAIKNIFNNVATAINTAY